MSLDAIGIVSKDIEKSVKFYGLLGVDISEIGAGPDHLEGTTPSGVRIMLDSEKLMKEINPDWQRGSGAGIILAFKQDLPEKVDQVYTSICVAGFGSVKEPWDAFWGQRYACVSDPDGNQVDLFAGL